MKSMPPIRPGRCLLALAAVALLACTAASAQENLDAGKPAKKLFAESCATCHRSARGLSKGRFSLTLYLYLQQHYAANSSSAWALTSYLEAVDAEKRGVKRAAASPPPSSTPPSSTPRSSSWSSRSSLRPPAPVPNR
jgi:mono/diheme cytochrome c family protein